MDSLRRGSLSENNVVNGRNLLSGTFMGSEPMSGFDVSPSVAVTVPDNEEHLSLLMGNEWICSRHYGPGVFAGQFETGVQEIGKYSAGACADQNSAVKREVVR